MGVGACAGGKNGETEVSGIGVRVARKAPAVDLGKNARGLRAGAPALMQFEMAKSRS